MTFEGLTPGDYEIVLSNALGCTYAESFTIDVPQVISDPDDVLDYIDVRLESSPTQFLNAMGLPEVVTYDNGTRLLCNRGSTCRDGIVLLGRWPSGCSRF